MISLVHVSGLITCTHSGSSALIHHHPLTLHGVSHHFTMVLLHEKFLLHIMVRHLSQVVLDFSWATIWVYQGCCLSWNRVASLHVLSFNLALGLCCSCMGTLLVSGCLLLGFLLHGSFHSHPPSMLCCRVWAMMMMPLLRLWFLFLFAEKPEKLAICICVNGSISISF